MSASSTLSPIPAVPPAMSRGNGKLVATMFVAVWRSCYSSDEAAERLGMPHDTAVGRADHFRSAGLTLDELPREEKRLDCVIQRVTRSIAESRAKGASPRP